MSEEDAAEVVELEPAQLFEALASFPGVYERTAEGQMDRYRDYRAVFLGSEQGRRVLHDILANCGLNKATPPVGSIDPYLTHIRDGRRGAALEIIGAIYKEPAQKQPTTQTRRA